MPVVWRGSEGPTQRPARDHDPGSSPPKPAWKPPLSKLYRSSSVKIRAAHEVVAAWAAELALLVLQFMRTAWAPAPIFPPRLPQGVPPLALLARPLGEALVLILTPTFVSPRCHALQDCERAAGAESLGRQIRRRGNLVIIPASETASCQPNGSGLFRSLG